MPTIAKPTSECAPVKFGRKRLKSPGQRYVDQNDAVRDANCQLPIPGRQFDGTDTSVGLEHGNVNF